MLCYRTFKSNPPGTLKRSIPDGATDFPGCRAKLIAFDRARLGTDLAPGRFIHDDDEPGPTSVTTEETEEISVK